MVSRAKKKRQMFDHSQWHMYQVSMGLSAGHTDWKLIDKMVLRARANCLIAWNFRGFGGIRAKGKFEKFGENSGEFTGIQMGFWMALFFWIQWEFLGDFGATPGFLEIWVFGVVSGDLGSMHNSQANTKKRFTKLFWGAVKVNIPGTQLGAFPKKIGKKIQWGNPLVYFQNKNRGF